MAREFNRLAGVKGDETLDLIAALLSAGKISKAYVRELVVEHTMEARGQIIDQATPQTPARQ